MNIRSLIQPEIVTILDEALAQGFRVFVPVPRSAPRGLGRVTSPAPLRFAHVCLDLEGSFATICGTSNYFDVPTLGAPITPGPVHGSSVLIDYVDTADVAESATNAVAALRRVCESSDVLVRFSGQPAPVVPNYGKKVVSTGRGGAGRFTEVTVETLAADAPEETATEPEVFTLTTEPALTNV